jgi:two-component system chemotaxis sensor kinase CheA
MGNLALMLPASLPDKGEVDELTREFIAESRDGLERMELCLTELENRPADCELVAEIFRVVHTIKGTTGFLGFSRLQTLAHAGEGLLAGLRDGTIEVTGELISGLLALVDGLNAILQLIEDAGTDGVRSMDNDRELIALLAELKARPAGLTAEGAHPGQQQPARRHDQDAGGAVSPSVAAASSAQYRTLRIDVEALNRMMNLVGDLVLTRNQILQSVPDANNFPELARRLNKVTCDLRESVMKLRMQPIGHLFAKFPRVVRDVAKTCGRQARVEFEGQDTGLDKSLLEAIRDPLTHAVRNAVDHGIEPAELRAQVGKPVEGFVRLRAFQQSGSVVIEVMDDGAGISTERVLAKAIEHRLITAEHAGAMTKREALQMIFLRGFSTTCEVTNISGRGVGMDVVRTNVEKVGGSVEVESQVGVGTTVRLRVPLTLAIVPALVVQSGGQSFALPQNSLTELVYVPKRDAESVMERVGTAELFRLRDGTLPIVWLDRLLGLERSVNTMERGFYIAALDAEGRRFGLVVDDLKAPEEIVVKPISRVLREIGLFSGATLLGNGVLALILDVTAVAIRAGVRPVAEPAVKQESNDPLPDQRAESELENSMVIYESWKLGSAPGGSGKQMAIPLSAVERIERIPLCDVEYADGRALLQYDGELIALEDRDDVLPEMVEAARARRGDSGGRSGLESPRSSAGLTKDPAALATVLICLTPGTERRRVGIVVRRVLDVSTATLLAGDTRLSRGQLAMVKSSVTAVHPDFACQLNLSATPMLQEVA